MRILLLSTYDMGRQPFGLASPAAWLRRAGHSVLPIDLSIDKLPDQQTQDVDLVAFHLPMHTATRLAVPLISRLREQNPAIHICCYGLYAPLNADFLTSIGVNTILGGESEQALVDLAADLGQPVLPPHSLPKLNFQVPDRSALPILDAYAQLKSPEGQRRVGYTEASRGCRHLCRHCPVVPVYNGAFRVVQSEIVLADIRQQVAAGAQHITFGDPDFFNGPTHARRIVEALHAEFPALTYDATIKIEHLLRHRDLLPVVRDTGCAFVTSAVESTDDAVLAKLDKGHTRADFIEVAHLFRQTGLTLTPTFIAFHPWTTLETYRSFLTLLRDLDLIDHVSPVQLALRLLIPAGSRMLELPDVQALLDGWDAPALLHRWHHPNPEIDALATRALQLAARKATRRQAFASFWELAHGEPMPDESNLIPRAAIPYLDEPWYC